MRMRGMLAWMVVGVMLAACPPSARERCRVGETRCDGEVAEACDPVGRWQRLLDCARVSELTRARFVCSQIVVEDDEVGRLEGHSCVPAGAASSAGDAGVAVGGAR